MDGIDLAYLKELLTDLQRQESEGLIQAHRARGAIMVVEALVEKVESAKVKEAKAES
jgi:hypothetical protein